jgi:cell division protein FtsB
MQNSEVDLGIWKFLTRILYLLLVAGCIVLIVLWYLPQIQINQRLRQRSLQLDMEIQKEREYHQKLRNELEPLQRDPRAVEREARQSLTYGKTNETIFKFEPLPSNNHNIKSVTP